MISKLLLWTCVLCVALAPLAIRGAEQPQPPEKAARTEWLHGLDYFEKAEKARVQDSIKDALILFRKAASIFKNIKKKHPDWHPKLINFRIALCAEKIDGLQVELDKRRLTVTDADTENVFLKETAARQKKELVSLKNELAETLAKVEAAKREAAREAASSANLESLMKDKTELEKKCALLEAMNKKLRSSAGGTTAADTLVDKKELEKALARVAELEKTNAQLRDLLGKGKAAFSDMASEKAKLEYNLKVAMSVSDSMRKKLEKLSTDLEEKTKTLEKTNKNRSTLSDQLADTRKQLTDARKSIEKLRADLKEVRTKKGNSLVKQLENENELILKDLELTHLEMEKIKKEQRATKAQLDEKTRKLREVERILAQKDKMDSTSLKDLRTLRDKLFVSEATIKKQNTALAKERGKYEKLKHDFDALAEKYKKVGEKWKDFSDLAGKTVRLESANRNLTAELEKTKKEMAGLKTSMMEAEKRLASMGKKHAELLEEKDALEGTIAKTSLNAEAAGKIQRRIAELEKKNADLLAEKNKKACEAESVASELAKTKVELARTTKRLQETLKIVRKQPLEKSRPQAKTASADTALLKEENAKLKKALEEALKKAEKPQVANAAEPAGKTVELEKENAILKAELEALRNKIKIISKKRSPKPIPVASVDTSAALSHGKQFERLLNLASTAEKNGKKEVAAWYYKKAMAIAPEDPSVATKLGYLYAETGNEEKAVPLLRKAVAKDPNNIDALLALAFCHIRRNENYLALGAAARASSLRPEDPRIQRYLGIICDNLGWKKAAEKQFKNSFKLDPTSAETAYNAAALLATVEGRRNDALLWYKKALELGVKRDPGLEKELRFDPKNSGAKKKP